MTSHFDCADNANHKTTNAEENNQSSLNFADVHGFATQLANSNSNNVNQTLTAIDRYLYNKSEPQRQEFLADLNSDLEQSQKLAQVMNNFVHSQYVDRYGQVQNTFDYLRHGHKRLSDQDLAQDVRDFDSIGRGAEANLMQNMMYRQPGIEEAHYEGAFLGIGGSKSGVDAKRMDKYAKNEERARETGDIASMFGLDQSGYVSGGLFYEISHNKSFITKDDVKNAIAEDSLNPPNERFSNQEIAALVFMRDNFGKVADYSVDPDNKTINSHSLLHYAKKQHVNIAPGEFNT